MPSGIERSVDGRKLIVPCESAPRPQMYNKSAERGRRKVVTGNPFGVLFATSLPDAELHAMTLPSETLGKGVWNGDREDQQRLPTTGGTVRKQGISDVVSMPCPYPSRGQKRLAGWDIDKMKLTCTCLLPVSQSMPSITVRVKETRTM